MQQRQQTGGRGKAYLFLGVSLVAAVIAALLVVQLLRRADQQLKEAQKPSETVDVIVATRNLYMGIPIQEGDVVVTALAPEMVVADVVFTSLDNVLQRTPKERILANEIVRAERLARRESGIGLNAIITPGKRAVAVAVKAEEAVAGFIQPLNYVDLIVVIKPDNPEDYEAKTVSKVLLQGVKVLAVGSSLGGDEEAASTSSGANGAKAPPKKKAPANTGVVKGKRTVTLEVTLEEAEQIALAAAKGDIVLALRADIDITNVTTQGATADGIIGTPVVPDEPVAPLTTMAKKGNRNTTPAPAEPERAEVYQGDQKSSVKVNADGTTESTKEKGGKR